MSTLTTRGHSAAKQKPGRRALRRILTGVMVLGLGGAGLPAAANAAIPDTNYPGIFSGWDTVGQNYWSNGAVGPDAPANAPDGGKLLSNTSGTVVVSGDLKIPDGAEPGDEIVLKADTADYRVKAFSGLEIKTADGTLVATAKGSSSNGTVTFVLADSVRTLQNVTASFEFSLTPQATAENRYGLPVDFATPSGAELSTGDAYNVLRNAPNMTGVLGGAGILSPDNELYVQYIAQYRDVRAGSEGKPLDPASVKVVVHPKTPGMTQICGPGAFSIRWLDENGLAVPTTEVRADSECQPDGSVIATLPAGTVVPTDGELIQGVSIRVNYVVDRPSFDYEADSEIHGTTVGSPVQDGTQTGDKSGIFNRVVRSAAIGGTGDGEIRSAAVTTEKTRVGTGKVLVGDTVEYRIAVKNTEEYRTAYGVVVTDALPTGLGFVSASDGGKLANGKVTWPAQDIAPGESRVVTVKAKVLDTVGDSSKNVAAVTGENICETGDALSKCDDDELVNILKPGADLDKRVADVEDTNANGFVGDAGDTIRYEFEVKNTGNGPLDSAKLEDELLGLADYEVLADSLPKGETRLAVEQQEGDFSYVITEEDGLAGSVKNVATLTPEDAPPTTDEVDEDAFAPSFEFEKSVTGVEDTNENGIDGDAGDTISWGFEVTNTGNSPIESVKLTDEMLGIEGQECLAEGTVLAPHAGDGVPADEKSTASCEGEFTHVITAADVEAGKVVNVATATSPGADEQEDSTETDVLPSPKKPDNGDPKGAVTGDPLASTGAKAGLLGGIAALLTALGFGTAVLRRRMTAADTSGDSTVA
ncbi:DUF7507 domain-containing protein [Leucobacter tenebrionis]|uniref:DUF7507 domain-containing protein n=1 Tax=Leucobacter tenebrionis TaxID=2873270 RepID=UPI001CA79ED8|nr:Ig-like domain-containing protein [Leucobacter tenebrionis]QZY52262.1 DUF11 domain-containing protein [Leucobacter tenebrionis]